MENDINHRILKKIEDADLAPRVKTFLIQMLDFELDHISEPMPRYSKEYQRAIRAGSRLRDGKE
jgi:hypothetical protein